MSTDAFEPPKHITFYIGTNHFDFKKKIQKELIELEKRDMDYYFFERSNRIMPRLCMDGFCVAGLTLIKNELHNILATSR